VNEHRLTQALKDSGLDAIIAASRENVLYLSGVRNMSHDLIPSRHTFVVWPREGEPSYIVIASEEKTAQLESRIKNIRTYKEFHVSPVDVLVATLKEKGLDGKRLGLEWRGTTAEVHHGIQRQLPNAKVERVDDVLDQVRMVKTEEEMRILAGATYATERAIRAAYAAAKPGDTERDITNTMAKHLWDGGADNVAWIVLGAGDNAAIVHPKASSYRIKKGDIVRVDLGAWFSGYLSDLGRTAVVGRPSQQQRDYYDKLRRAEDAVIAAAKPGRPVKDLYHACMETLSHGAPKINLPSFPHIGHGIGVGLHEYPMITATGEEQLQPGMVMCVEPAFMDMDGLMYHIEETIQITEGGCDVLTYRDPWRDVFVIE
jgi:Xaa-Pro aminopeptidase